MMLVGKRLKVDKSGFNTGTKWKGVIQKEKPSSQSTRQAEKKAT